MSNYETLLVERRDAVTLVTLNRLRTLNALDAELLDVIRGYDADPAQQTAAAVPMGTRAPSPRCCRSWHTGPIDPKRRRTPKAVRMR